MFHDIVDDRFRHQLKRCHPAATGRLAQVEKADGSIDITQSGKGGDNGLMRREQLQCCGRDDPERAFGPDEKVFQVIAGVIFFEGGKQVHDPPVRDNHLKPEAERPGVAIAHHPQTACIGGKIAADPASPARAEIKREQQSFSLGTALDGFQNAACLNHHGVAFKIEAKHLIHPFQRQHNGITAGIRGCAAAKTGITALGDNRHAVFIGVGENAADFIGGTGMHHRRCRAGVMLAPVGQVRRGFIRIGDDGFGPADRGQGSDDGVGIRHVKPWQELEQGS